ncbi:MAG TPA: hypothetical protein VES19_03775 [Candidatus Limnocylindrales bacterium]|nr:hypothetical protein [Candidatus Limnocylindrales bacterium]
MTTPDPRAPRDQESWARPVERLTTTAKTAGQDTVTGRRVAGPVQGFGQMWQKTFAIRVPADEHSPEAVVAHWKERFPTFWPKGAKFYAPLAGITPGEVALLEIAPVPGSPVKMSTGVMVIYADRESFTFMTPEGHALSAWITFSAYRDGDETVVQAQALERTSDPFIELTYIFGANRSNDRFWEQTLANLGRSLGVAEPVVETTKVCVDRRRQWKYARNLTHSPALHMAVGTVTAPARWVRRRRAAS